MSRDMTKWKLLSAKRDLEFWTKAENDARRDMPYAHALIRNYKKRRKQAAANVFWYESCLKDKELSGVSFP